MGAGRGDQEKSGDLNSKIGIAEKKISGFEASKSQITDAELQGPYKQYIDAARAFITQAQISADGGDEKDALLQLEFLEDAVDWLEEALRASSNEVAGNGMSSLLCCNWQKD
ncbi:hypothetical protein PsAD5_02222 [Pseudovibrio sp. Ad5]|uniref:hypothetical protein n=1 Tax=Pseudovibrio sp. Ad5 TaxID=989436 RepID=UPI0007AE7024|nr:hypothetical protein [Pseudovibrio sp. Ad5]KZK97983.1 hypothetical protein PsAD5_02222 [Pseudovibrio sp. Ad5]